MANNNLLLHEKFSKLIQPDWIVIDMTAGNGHDTLFLAQHAKEVYSIDIQQQAIENTKELTKNHDSITYIVDDHQNIHHYVKPYVNCVFFNLGYLPGGDKSIKTNKDSTLISLSKVHQLLKIGSYLVITCYPGHSGGKQETEAVTKWVNHQKDKKQYEVEVLDYPTKNSPITYICKRIDM